jgi:hypothetical protein
VKKKAVVVAGEIIAAVAAVVVTLATAIKNSLDTKVNSFN